MNADTEQASLTAILGDQVRCAEAMLETLARESTALTDGDHDALELATQAKTALVDALEQLESRRRQLSHEDDAAGGDQWQHLRELIARCKVENQRNGTLLQARAANLRVALKALRGAEPELYSATGRTPSQTDARPLGTA